MTDATIPNDSNQGKTKESAVNPELQSSLELKKCLYDICEPMCIKIAQNKPKDISIANFMINYLKTEYNYSSTGLCFEEQKELEYLRSQVEMFKEIEEHTFYSEQSKVAKKDIKPAEKKGKAALKPKARLPPEDNILSDDEDYKNLDDVDPNLDNIDFIKNCVENNKRFSVTENCFIYDKESLPNIKMHRKNPELFEFIRINLIKSPVFSELNFDVLKCIIDAMEEKNIPAVTDVVKQGDIEETFYFVAEGELECKMQFTKITQEGNRKKVEKFEPKLVRIYSPGDYFGELSLLYHTPRRGTIRAVTDVKLYSLSRSVYKQILRKANEEKTEKIINALKNVKMFSMLEQDELEKLETISKEVVYSNGEIIIKENEFSNTLMILDKGKCLGTKTEENGKIPIERSKYKEGDALFEKAVLRPEKSEENILANSDCVKFICIDRNGLKNSLGQYEPILMRNLEYYQQIFPPEEDKSEEEEKKRKEEEEEKKRKEEEEEKKRKEEEEEKKRKEEEEAAKMPKKEEIDNMREEIKRYQQELEDRDKKYEELLKKFQEQQTNIIPPTNINVIPNINNIEQVTNDMIQTNNNIQVTPEIPGNDNQDININNMNNMNNLKENEANIIEQSNNNMMNPEFNDENKINNEDRREEDIREEDKILEERKVEEQREEKEEDKKSKASSTMFLKDKLIYQGNEENIFAQMNEQNKDPNLNDDSRGRGSIIEE